MQGFLYVTAGHLCFYAYLAQKEVRFHARCLERAGILTL